MHIQVGLDVLHVKYWSTAADSQAFLHHSQQQYQAASLRAHAKSVAVNSYS